MVQRSLADVREAVNHALVTDNVVFVDHARSHHYRPADVRMVLMHGRLGYGKPGPEGERYTADAVHPTLGPSRVVFSVQEPNVIVISAYEKW